MICGFLCQSVPPKQSSVGIPNSIGEKYHHNELYSVHYFAFEKKKSKAPAQGISLAKITFPKSKAPALQVLTSAPFNKPLPEHARNSGVFQPQNLPGVPALEAVNPPEAQYGLRLPIKIYSCFWKKLKSRSFQTWASLALKDFQ